MARHVGYRCRHCGSWSKVSYTEDIGDNTVATCNCSNPECQAIFQKIISHFKDIRPPISEPVTQHLGFF